MFNRIVRMFWDKYMPIRSNVPCITLKLYSIYAVLFVICGNNACAETINRPVAEKYVDGAVLGGYVNVHKWKRPLNVKIVWVGCEGVRSIAIERLKNDTSLNINDVTENSKSKSDVSIVYSQSPEKLVTAESVLRIFSDGVSNDDLSGYINNFLYKGDVMEKIVSSEYGIEGGVAMLNAHFIEKNKCGAYIDDLMYFFLTKRNILLKNGGPKDLDYVDRSFLHAIYSNSLDDGESVVAAKSKIVDLMMRWVEGGHNE